LNSEQRIESLTTVFTPQAAKMVQLAPTPTHADERAVPFLANLAFSTLVLGVGFVSGGAFVYFLVRRRDELLFSKTDITQAWRHSG
jgi:hypothetical protein